MASVEPEEPEPARVVTTPVDITIFRILWLLESATYRFVPSVVIPLGLLNFAEVPVASVEPVEPEPAKVVISFILGSCCTALRLIL